MQYIEYINTKYMQLQIYKNGVTTKFLLISLIDREIGPFSKVNKKCKN